MQLHFSGHLVSTGSCQQLAQNVLRCQVPAGSPGTIELQATVTPSGYPVNISAVSLPTWASFTPTSGYGVAVATCTFQPPAEAAGQTFQLVFRASTVYGLHVDLTVILDMVSGQPPTGPITGATDEEGKFSVLIQPGTTVTGRLTECTVRPLPNQEFSLTPVYEGDAITAFNISVTGYAPVTITGFGMISLFGLASYLFGRRLP